MKRQLKSNIWKFFLFTLTNRRNYYPILSLYFLTLQNTTAQQIGLFTGIGWLMGFIFEIPSGYISDKFGHKNTLILAKIFMITSTLFYVFGNSIVHFAIGSSLVSLGFAFTSGTGGAFLHNTLIGLKREKEYSEVRGKISAYVSLISAAMILALPLLTKISVVMPLKAYLILDVFGIISVFSLYSPRMKYSAEDEEGENILSQLKRFRGTGFYITSVFIGLVSGFVMGLSPYREVFVTSLGFPIILVGLIMALSRAVWFIVGHNIKILKKIKMKNLLLYEIFFFSGLIVIASQLKNPWIIVFIVALWVGYYQGRGVLFEEYYLNNFLINRRFKATMISIKQQIEQLFGVIMTFAIGFIMAMSYRLGFLVAGICLFVVSLIIYPFVRRVLIR